jgi:hypothetical protein
MGGDYQVRCVHRPLSVLIAGAGIASSAFAYWFEPPRNIGRCWWGGLGANSSAYTADNPLGQRDRTVLYDEPDRAPRYSPPVATRARRWCCYFAAAGLASTRPIAPLNANCCVGVSAEWVGTRRWPLSVATSWRTTSIRHLTCRRPSTGGRADFVPASFRISDWCPMGWPGWVADFGGRIERASDSITLPD